MKCVKANIIIFLKARMSPSAAQVTKPNEEEIKSNNNRERRKKLEMRTQ